MEPEQEMSLWVDLLPGIHDDITFTHIATKLSWTAFHALSSVNRTWQQAIQSRKVYRERSRCQSTETLVVFGHRGVNPSLDHDKHSVSLYSMTEKAFYDLPPIPQFESGISRHSQFISMEGKLYVLGADSELRYQVDSKGDIHWPLQEHMKIYVLDLAGQRQWESCTRVPELEREYAFDIGCGFAAGRKHCVRGGSADWFKSVWHVCDAIEGDWRMEQREWRAAESSQVPLQWQNPPLKFTVQGKNFSVLMGPDGETHAIHLDELHTKSSTLQHSISWNQNEIDRPSNWPLKISPLCIFPLNNELLAVARWIRWDSDEHQNIGFNFGYCILQSKGFGTKSKEIVWQKAPHRSLYFESDSSFAMMCPIQL